jgi:hypothetical protein
MVTRLCKFIMPGIYFHLFSIAFLLFSNGSGFPSTTQQYDSHKLSIYLMLEVFIDIKSML